MNTFHEQLIIKSRNYKVPHRAIQLLQNNHPLIVAGVTASGKNTIINYIKDRSDYRFVVTHTTRKMRSKESNGNEHWFVTDKQMMQLLEAGALIESQPIHGQEVYGTSFASYEVVVNAGYKPIMDMNIDGISNLTEHIPHLEPIFVLPPSFELWMERLGGRDTMSDGERQRRLRSARLEIEAALKNKNFILIINHEVDDTAHQIMMGVSAYAYDQPHNRALAEELIEYLRDY